jgi:hypothetical protein
MPEVMPPLNAGVIKMSLDIQDMSRKLMRAMNPTITDKQWTAIHSFDRAFTNGSGFNDASDPRVNYILGTDLFAPLPVYDKAQRVCGGSFIRGEAVGDKLICTSGVHGINPSEEMPSVEQIIDQNWYIYAVSMDAPTKISHFPQGNGGVVPIPFIFSGSISFPLIHFQRWQSDTLPDPLRIYE